MSNSLPRPLTPRALWHWAYYHNRDSVMNYAAEIAKLGILSQPSGLAGDWSKTKAGHTSFGWYSSPDAQIWANNQRQVIRGEINKLPKRCRALGNVLYLPIGSISSSDLMVAHSSVFSNVIDAVDEQMPTLRPEIKGKLFHLSYCAITHYWKAISPAIEGGTATSMEAVVARVKKMFEDRGSEIDTRYWSRQYRPLWLICINEIRKIDDEALIPLDRWIGDYFRKIEIEKERERKWLEV